MIMNCDRCGRCCHEFSEQIHFLPEEEFLLKNLDFKDKFIDKKVMFFRKNMELFKKTVKDKLRFFIPTKTQVFPYLDPQSQKFLTDGMKNGNECMFLSWQGEISSCEIHQYNPQMCKDYPTAKGGVCKAHPERKYSQYFYLYQKQKIGFAVHALQQIYESQISHAVSFEILTILMDFGDFNQEKLLEFFEKRNYSKIELLNAIDELKDLGLIFQEQNRIQGISLKEVEVQIDKVMRDHGWHYPQ